jgi:hypothetical protein
MTHLSSATPPAAPMLGSSTGLSSDPQTGRHPQSLQGSPTVDRTSRAGDPSKRWIRRSSVVINRRIVTYGTEVSIRGERGRFRFIQAVETPSGAQWLDFIGGPVKAEKWRSFRPDRVRRVHRINKTRPNLT